MNAAAWLKKISIILIFCLLQIAFVVRFVQPVAGLDVSGNISGAVNWTLADSPVHLTGNVTLTSGTLTIDEGVQVLSNAYYTLTIQGALDVNGTVANPVIFKHNSLTSVGQWGGIYINSTGSATIDYADIRYTEFAISVNGGSLTINNSFFDTNHTGISVYNKGSLTTSTNTFYNSTYAPLYIEPEHGAISLGSGGNADILGAGGDSNGYNAIGIGYPWWDSGSQTADCSANTCTTSQLTFAGISNIPYFFHSSYYLDGSDDTWVVEAGVIFKFAGGLALYTRNGAKLDVNGTIGNVVYFTSYRDDTVGGDTNNNGATTGSYSDWDAIFLTSGANTIDYAKFTFADISIHIYGTTSSLAVNDSIFESDRTGFSVYNRASITSNRNTFNKLTYAPIYLEPEIGTVSLGTGGNADILGTGGDLNGYNAIGIGYPWWNGGSQAADCSANTCTTSQLTFAGISNIPYFIHATYNFDGSDDTWVVEAGVIFKFASGTAFTVRNGAKLDVNGTIGNVVYFTSYRDDTVGGDTNNNGATTGNFSDWDSIYLPSGVNTIDYAKFTFADNAINDYGSSTSLTINDTIFESNRIGISVYNRASIATQRNTFNKHTYAPLYIEPEHGTISLGSGGDTDILGTGGNLNGYNAIGMAYNAGGVNQAIDCGDNTCSLLQLNFAGISNIPYFVHSIYYFDGGDDTLNIAAGVIIKFGSGSSLSIRNGAKLDVNGTNGNLVYFTSYRDDTVGGDTNNNGATTGTYSDWDAVNLAGGANTIDYAKFTFADITVHIYGASSSLAVNDSIFESDRTGFSVYNRASITSNRNTFNKLTYAPIYLEPEIGTVSLGTGGDADILGTGGNLNGYNAIGIGYPWWNSGNQATDCNANTCSLNQLTFAGISNIPYYVHASYNFDGGDDNLAIAAGVTLKFNASQLLIRSGARITVSGTADEPVNFTSYRDDSAGGDTNNNGASSGSTSDWANLDLESTGAHVINFAKVRYSSEGIYFNNTTNATVNDSIISNNNIGLFFITGTSPTLARLNIENNVTWGAYNHTGTTMNAQNLYWGNVNGPNDTDAAGACTTNVSAANAVRDTAGNPIDYCPYANSRNNTVSNLLQYKLDGSTLIPTGNSTEETGAVTKLQVDSFPSNTSLYMQTEVKPLGAAFDNIPSFQGSGVSFSGSPVIASATIPDNLSFPDWYDVNWTDRAEVVIDNTAGGLLTDYQIRIKVDFWTGMKTDFGDLRFTNSAGTLLPYWTETVINSSNAIVWVKVDSVTASAFTYIYMYYGNAGVSSASDGTQVFSFFDEFDSLNSATWDSTGSVTFSGSMVNLNRNAGVDANFWSKNAVVSAQPFIVQVKYQRPSFNRNRLYLANSANAGSPTNDYGDFSNTIYWNGFTNITLANNHWYDMAWINTNTSYSWNIYDNLSYQPLSLQSSAGNFSSAKFMTFIGNENDSSDFSMDSIFVRSYAAVEPVVSVTNQVVLENSTSYHWQARICDNYTNCSSWVAFGGNAENEVDFEVVLPNILPVASDVNINSSAADIDLTENTTAAVHCTATVTDADGFADIQSVEARFFRTSLGAAGAGDNNFRYIAAGDAQCVPSGGSGNTENYDCTLNVYFHADATDGSSPQPGDDWTCQVTPSDLVGAGTNSTDTIEMNSLIALNVTNSIDFGAVTAGNDTGAVNNTATITSTGNVAIDSLLRGDNLCTDYPACSGSQIPVGSQEYSLSLFTWGAGTDLTGIDATVHINLGKPTASPSNQTINTYWGIGIPALTAPGTYQGSNYFTASLEN